MRELRMPNLTLGEEDDLLFLGWSISEGAQFTEGTVLAEVETSKAVLEVEAPFDGVLTKVLVARGDRVATGDVIAHVSDPGEASKDGLAPSTAQRADGTSLPAELPRRSKELAAGSRRHVEPSSHRPAPAPRPEYVEHGELGGVPLEWHGMAADGSVQLGAEDRSLDVAGVGPYERLQMSRHRLAVARAMTRSLSIPQFAVFRDLPTIAIEPALANLRELVPESTLSDLFILATARALRTIPELNAWFAGTQILRFGQVNICLAVDGPDGVVAPVIRDVGGRPSAEVVGERKRLVSAARTGHLAAADLLGGTFTISNLGTLGADAVVPLLSSPQVGALGLGRIREVGALSAVVVADHRAVDGADAARFLGSLVESLASMADNGATDERLESRREVPVASAERGFDIKENAP